MRKGKRTAIVAVFLVLGVALTTLLAAFLATYVGRIRAQGLLTAVREVRVGVDDYQTVSQLTAPYRAYSTESNDRGMQEIQFAFDNRWLFRLKLAPYTDFRVRIVLQSGIVIEKFAREFLADCGCAASVMEVKRGLPFPEASAQDHGSDHLVFGFTPDSRAPVRRIAVYDHASYEESGPSNDWGFDLSCLTRLGGCRDARALLPTVGPVPH